MIFEFKFWPLDLKIQKFVRSKFLLVCHDDITQVLQKVTQVIRTDQGGEFMGYWATYVSLSEQDKQLVPLKRSPATSISVLFLF